MTQTKLNYTGQKLDDTGLLYYNIRYYDPTLARFVSPTASCLGLPLVWAVLVALWVVGRTPGSL